MMIKEINTTKVEGKFDSKAMVTKMSRETGRTGKEHCLLTLTDSTDELKARYWETDIFDKVKVGDIVAVNIEAKPFNNVMSFTLKTFYLLTGEDPAMYRNSFVPDEEEMKNYLRSKIADIYKSRSDLRVVLEQLFAKEDINKFFKWAAATCMHHGELNGLLFHTVSMLRHAEALMETVPLTYGIEPDRHLVNTAIIMHDFFKTKEYVMNEAGKADVSKYVILGHIVMGAQFLGYLKYAELIGEELYLQLSHILVSHHGELEYGAAARIATVEAHIVHTVDNFDAKMYMLKSEYRKTNEGELAANKHFGLQTNVYNPINLASKKQD